MLSTQYSVLITLKNMKIAILGAGESGTGAALLAKAKGFEVFVSDMGSISTQYKNVLSQANIDFEEGQHSEDRILNADEVIKSPGIPDKAPLIKKLYAQGTSVISELEFAARYTKAKIIAITGSNGKTTTTLLTYHLFKKAGLNVGLGGNIGDSFAKQVINDTFDYFILEISSFQLDNMYKTKADVAMILNITPDHLDRYDYKFENYIDSKFRIIQNQTSAETFITSIDNETVAQELGKRNIVSNTLKMSLNQEVTNGASLVNENLNFNVNGNKFSIPLQVLPIEGKHNISNAMAAILALETVRQKFQADKTFDYAAFIADFQNVAHRLEKVATINGVLYINDSKATNVDSVYYALEAMTKPVIWIAGGVDKGNDYAQIEELVKSKVKTLICLGTDSSKLETYFNGKVAQIVSVQSMKACIEEASKLASTGDVVLLSPACASFDLFKNYEDRGNQFKEIVFSYQ